MVCLSDIKEEKYLWSYGSIPRALVITTRVKENEFLKVSQSY